MLEPTTRKMHNFSIVKFCLSTASTFARRLNISNINAYSLHDSTDDGGSVKECSTQQPESCTFKPVKVWLSRASTFARQFEYQQCI